MADVLTKKRLQRLGLISFVALIALLGFGMLFLSQLIHYINLPSPSASTTGRIYVTRPASRRSHAQCAVIFEVNGKKYENYSTGCSWYNSGDEVTIYYKTTDPSEASLEARNVGYLFGFIGLIFAIITYLLIANFRNKLKNGE